MELVALAGLAGLARYGKGQRRKVRGGGPEVKRQQQLQPADEHCTQQGSHVSTACGHNHHASSCYTPCTPLVVVLL